MNLSPAGFGLMGFGKRILFVFDFHAVKCLSGLAVGAVNSLHIVASSLALQF